MKLFQGLNHTHLLYMFIIYNSVASMRGSIGHDNLTIPEYSKLSNVNNSTAVNDEEEIYSDPG